MVEARFYEEVEEVVVLIEAEADKASVEVLELVQAVTTWN